jgi:hypothetical protein
MHFLGGKIQYGVVKENTRRVERGGGNTVSNGECGNFRELFQFEKCFFFCKKKTKKMDRKHFREGNWMRPRLLGFYCTYTVKQKYPLIHFNVAQAPS